MASKDIGQLRTRLSWEDEGANKSLEGFRRDLKGLRSEMNLAKSHGKDYTNSLKGMREQSDILSRRFQTQEERVKELRKRYDESVKVKGEDAKQTQDLAAQLNNATAEMNRTEGQLQRLNEEIRRMESPWTKLGEQMTNAGEKFQTVGKHMTEFGKSYSMRVTAPIVAGGVAFFKAASDYESAFAGVRKTTEASEEEFAALSRGIREMAKELPASATSIASVAESAGQLGIAKEDLLDFTRVMIDLGESTNMTSEEAATQLARFANITGMSMKEVSNLGSTIVDLGNNSATTEGEIVSLGMRIAAAGKQAGLTEAEIMAISAAASSLGVEAEAGGTALSMAFTKITNAVDGGGKTLNSFAKASGMTAKDFAKAWKEEPTVAFNALLKGLNESSEAGKNMTGILDDLGIKGIREIDVMKRMSGAHELVADSMKIANNAWKENTALSEEAAQRYGTTESQLKILWNRAKDMAITMGDALIPAFMDALNAAEPFFNQIESGARKFSEMDESQQRAILKVIALVAAIGPATIGLGQLATGIGGVLKVGGSLATTLGGAGGAGLIGRVGLMGPAMGTPVGLAIAGVGALGLGIYALTKYSQENLEETVKSIQKRKEEIDSVDELIASFGELQRKNKLSTDEVLRYMDIMTELKDAKSEEAIKALTDEQAALLEKSGLTNDQMEEFLRLNGKLVEKAPETAKAISDQGNAYAAVLEEVKKLNEAERKRLTDDTYMTLTSEMNKQRDNLAKQEKLQKEIRNQEENRTKINGDILSINERIRGKDLEIADIRKKIESSTGREKITLAEQLMIVEDQKSELVAIKSAHEENEKRIDKQIKKKQESLEKTMRELKAFDELKDDYAQMVLYEQGIVSEKGKAVEKLKEEQSQLNKNRKELEKLKGKGEEFTAEYEAQNSKLNEQQAKIDAAKRKLEEMNAVAGRTIYKDVNVNTNPSINRFNELLRQTVTKRVNLDVSGGGGVARFSAYADGTPLGGHRGGPFIAGEEGFELGRLGNRWEMLNFGMFDRPQGYEVFTHDESKKIIAALNRMPAYADGASRTGEANRAVNQLNNQQPMNDSSATVVSLLKDIANGIRDGKIIQIDGETVTNIVNTNNAVGSIGNYFG